MTYLQPERHPADAYTTSTELRHTRPITIFGAGGIVRDAHLPAYRKARLTVGGIYNRTAGRAQALADEYRIPQVFSDVGAAIRHADDHAVFDLALMPEQYVDVLEQLPDGAPVLIQKPLGNDLAAAERIQRICIEKNLVAAVNTQLRFAPYVAAARQVIAAGVVGEIYDMEIRVQVNTPWHLFPNVLGLDRLEINAHSIHYLDLVRSFFGQPGSVSAVTVGRPDHKQNTRTEMLLHYPGRPLRVAIGANHDHRFGSQYEQSYIKWEGTQGAIRAQMGLLLDYPAGGPDKLEIQLDSDAQRRWRALPFTGSWFPDAFIGSMTTLHRFLDGSLATLPTSVGDGMQTMDLVEAAYRSADLGGVPVETRAGTGS